jgi:hypothetical protein
MKLKIYNRDNCYSAGGKNGASKPEIHFNHQGNISLSTAATKLINLQPGEKLIIAQDEENPDDWYIIPTQDPSAFNARFDKGNETNVKIQSASLVRQVGEFLKIKPYISFKLKISEEIAEVNKSRALLIITKTFHAKYLTKN